MQQREEADALDLGIENGRVDGASLVRRGIIVVGCHRSGTSALARVLSLVGCDLPRHLMPPRKGSNELGFWEPEAVVQAHDAFLKAIGSSWDDVSALPSGALASPPALALRQELAVLLGEEYGASPLFVVKDPRISRLLPLWFEVLTDVQAAAATALAVRNPLEVAASLKERDGFTATKSLLLWLRYTLESEQHSRGRPRSIVMYDELLHDWQGVLARVGDELDVSWPRRSDRATVEIERFLSERQRHHVYSWHDIEGRVDVVSWVKEAYLALRTSDPFPVLDQVRDELSRADIAFGPFVAETRLTLEASLEQTLEAAAARDALAAEVEERQLALDAQAAEVRTLRNQVGKLRDTVAASVSDSAKHRSEVHALRTEHEGLARESVRLKGEVRRLTTALAAAERRLSAADAEATGARSELTAVQTEVDRLQTVAREAAARAAALEAHSSAKREELLRSLAASRARCEQLEGEITAANAALGTLEARASTERADLLRQLQDARAAIDRLRERVAVAQSESLVERRRMLADLNAANAETARLASQLTEKQIEAEALASAADELLSIADAELDASQAERDRLQADLGEALEECAQAFTRVEHLEGALESTAAALDQHKEASAAAAQEAAARLAGSDAEVTRVLDELEAARGDLGNARAEVELVTNELEALRAETASERAKLTAEREEAEAERGRLNAELEAAHADARGLAARTEELEAALSAHRALLHALQSVTNRRTARRRSLSQLGTWLLPPTRTRLNYLRRYLVLRRSSEFDVDSYLLANPDVLAARINPLMHYVQYGCEEGRAVVGYIEPPVAADAIEASSSDAIDQLAGQVPSPIVEQVPPPTVEAGLAGADERYDGATSSVDDLIQTALPLLRPLRVFPTPTTQGRRLNLVTDSLNEGSVFGGVGTSIVLASLLAQRLDASLRVVTRLVPPNPVNFGIVQRAQGVTFNRNVEFAFVPLVGHESLPLHDRDLFLTTSWWSTWSTVRAVSPERIVYLIQEDERMFYPAGDEQAACSGTIADRRVRFVVNTAMLRDHLVQEGFSNIGSRGHPFEPAFPESLYFSEARPNDDSRCTFFFYARPNNVRNLFLHGLAAIDEAVSAGILDPDEWRFHFVGSAIPAIQLTRGVTPIVSENLPWPAYATLIRGVDLGLSLMSTPHPSYPPLDLAACGAVAITNRYGVKQDLSSYSRNIICSDLAHDAIVDAIAAGARLALDRETRQRNYESQQLSRSWDSSLSAILDELSDWA